MAGRAIDWEAARERLAAAERIISGEGKLTPEEIQRVLESRARTLSTPLAETSTDEALELLTFKLSGERYAVESKYVLAVFRLEHMALVPSAEPPLVGLTAWRGELLTLFDLRTLTGTSASGLSDLGWVVVLGESSGGFGILVDELQAISRMPVSEIRALPGGLPGSREYVRGMTADAMLVLDAGKLTRIHT